MMIGIALDMQFLFYFLISRLWPMGLNVLDDQPHLLPTKMK